MGFGCRGDEVEETVVDEQDVHQSRFRWLPGIVVLAAFSGFGVLAWHAYHYGAQSVDEGELMVVEADHGPIKEKPADPGGMKFPNQDKTVFETFSGGAANPPKVERVMPPPEEPMPKNVGTAETQTWINDKLKDGAVRKEENLAAEPSAPSAAPSARVVDVPASQVKMIKPEEVITHVKDSPAAHEAAVKSPSSEAKQETVKKKEPVVADAQKDKPVDAAASAAPPVSAPKPAAVSKEKAATGNQRIQLGAYGSEDEAKAAWSKMQEKFPELKGKTVYVVKADLGAKGIFYRLRAGGFADAKAFCAGLSAKGQACMMVP